MAERNVSIVSTGDTMVSLQQLHENAQRQILELTHEIEKKNKELVLKKASVTQARETLAGILNAMGDALFMVTEYDVIVLTNKAASSLLGYSGDELVGMGIGALINESAIADIRQQLKHDKKAQIHDYSLHKKNGDSLSVMVSCSLHHSNPDSQGELIIVLHDLTARKLLESQLLQAEKLESVGRLSSGIAHEINTPMQFIGDNTRFLRDSFSELGTIIDLLKQRHESITEVLGDKAKDLDYLAAEIPVAIQQTLDGISRVSAIVGAMKDFSHQGNAELQSVDINRQLESAVLITTNEWRQSSQLELKLDPTLPRYAGYPSELNQVWLNLIINAAHAVEDKFKKHGGDIPGRITVSTTYSLKEIVVSVQDNGCGIGEDIKSKIFDPFFTTKVVGRGSGQGLTLVRSVIVGKHHGFIDLDSTPGQGATFSIRLPLTRA